MDNFLKGLDAEIKIKKIVEQVGAITIHNIMLGSKEKTSQIDIIGIHKTGIYSLEVKHITGRIYGYRQQRYWKVYYNYQPRDMYNPVFQNEGHIRQILREAPIHIDLTDKIHNVVVVPDNTDLNTDAKEVIRESDLYTLTKDKPDVLTETQVTALTEYFSKKKKDNMFLHFVHDKQRSVFV